MTNVLIVDDEHTICWGIREYLTDEGFCVSIAPSAEEALEMIPTVSPDAIFLDVRLPGRDGLSALPDIRRSAGDVPIVVMTAFGNLETAVKSIEEGAVEYLTKPFDLDQTARIVRRLLVKQRRSGQQASNPVSAAHDSRCHLVGRSPAMQQVYKQIALVARSNVPVLITGESGTGKELAARAVHENSLRRSHPYVPVSLAAMSPTVIESELFGHVKGAFTGAEGDRQGCLDLAAEGTVLLDEIGDVPLEIQVKLLRVIEQSEFLPVGASHPRPAKLRIVAATHRNLPEMVAAGTFREDLYFRLNVFPIELPPLRERREDIPLLVRHFLGMSGHADPPPDIAARALDQLKSRHWHGNVRELRNAIEHASINARGRLIDCEHLPAPIARRGAESESPNMLQQQIAAWTNAKLQQSKSTGQPSVLYEELMNVVEKELFQAVLQSCQDNRTQAARMLGIHRATLRERLRKLGLD